MRLIVLSISTKGGKLAQIPCDIFVRLGGCTEICDSREGKMKRVEESFIRNGAARDEGCHFISPKVPVNCS